MHLGLAKCRIPFLGHCDLDLTHFLRIIMSEAFFLYYNVSEVGIPNLVCGCILEWQSVMYQFCDLDLISIIIVSGAYLLYY